MCLTYSGDRCYKEDIQTSKGQIMRKVGVLIVVLVFLAWVTELSYAV
jgi:hypothetical protein